MSRANSTRTAAVAMAIAFAANIAVAALPPVTAQAAPSALPLARFYPTVLPSSPGGRIEEPEVWLAKVQGLLMAAPPLLQQSLLASQTAQEFAANIALLRQMQEGLLKQSLLDMKNAMKSGRVSTKAFGDVSNLVYKPLEPCRIMDTRYARAGSGVQGPLADGFYHIHSFITSGSNWGDYGGSATSDCGLTDPPGTAIHAVAIVFTILNPTYDGGLEISDIGPGPGEWSVTLPYTRGQGLSTMYVVPTNYLIFFWGAGGVHLIFDVVGYYVLSDATALECTTQSSAPMTIGVGFSGSVTSPACSEGYGLSSGSCDSDSTSMKLTSDKASGSNTTWTCSANNAITAGAPAHLTATANCCRVPGK